MSAALIVTAFIYLNDELENDHRAEQGLEVIGKIAEAQKVEPAELLKVRSKRRRT